MTQKERLYISERAAEADAVHLLYRYAVGGLAISFLASSGLTLMAFRHIPDAGPRIWWALMVAVLGLRAWDVYRVKQGAPATIFRFGFGLMASSLMWAAFPLAFFGDIDDAGRAYTAIIVSAMVGGSATVLSTSQWLSMFYCLCLLLPTSALFLIRRGAENRILGVLGCLFFVVMAVSSRWTHRAIMTAVRLSRTNEALAEQMLEERRRTETANSELRCAQSELWEVNRSLESRIEARTADLEKEMAEKERYALELTHLASIDSLTGLSNRLTMAKRLSSALAEAAGLGETLALLFVDLDKFKEVNDVMGHPAGDRVLQAVAQRLKQSGISTVGLSRWGGDEFVMGLPGPVNPLSALMIANRFRTSLCEPIEVDGGTVMIDATVGIALYPEHGRTQEELIRAADMAMYAGKESQTKVRLFDRAIADRLSERHLLERALRDAMGTPELSLVFQPIIAAHSGRCEMAEALLRWNHPQRGNISPSCFIPIAERTGTIGAIGRWVLEQACREAVSWGGDDAPAVSVNVSASQISSGSLDEDVMDALERWDLAPQRLHLELTESVFAGDQAVINPVLRGLREKGVRISLDDFGTGFSCLSYLRSLPIDMIKIDRSFVEAVNVDAAPIIQTIVTTAQTFGLKTVAEGVETKLQARSLVDLSADYLQGFLFSKGISPELMREGFRHKESSWTRFVLPSLREHHLRV